MDAYSGRRVNKMSQWLNNNWVIAIGGGVLSGIFVTWLSRFLFSKRDSRERRERITTAKRELLYAIRPGVAEGVVPTPDVLESLIAATARKYELGASEVYTRREILEDLIKEVMDSSFISASAKAEFCLKLSYESLGGDGVDVVNAEFEVVEPSVSADRQKILSVMSAMLGLMAALMTAAVPFLIGKEWALKGTTKGDLPTVLLPTAVALVVAVLAAVALTLLKNPEALLKGKKRSDHEDDAGTDIK